MEPTLTDEERAARVADRLCGERVMHFRCCGESWTVTAPMGTRAYFSRCTQCGVLNSSLALERR